MRRMICGLMLFGTLALFACTLSLPQPDHIPETTSEPETTTAPPIAYETAAWDEPVNIRTPEEQEALERIDSAILTAVKLLHTVDKPPIAICDDDGDRPKQRESLTHPLSKEIYDYMFEKVSAFEDYHFSEKDYPGVDFFNVFVSALDALRIDHTELFLYCDARIEGTEYSSCYFLPGDWMGQPCEDREEIRAEVAFCQAILDRILGKMPTGLSNGEKCWYFVFVLAAGNTYDHTENLTLIDYPAYNAFVRGQTICSGYAQAFNRLCREAGISCWYCRGTTPTERHAWNMLDTAEGPVYVDVTWYDTDELGENYREGKEQYLFMTPEDFVYYGYGQESCQ